MPATNKKRFLEKHADTIKLLKDHDVGFFHMYTTEGSVVEALKKLKVTRWVYESARLHDPEFHNIIQMAQNAIDDEVEGILIRMAKGVLKETTKGQLTACLALLNNRRYKSSEDASQVTDPVIKKFMVLRPAKKIAEENPGEDEK